MLVRPSRANRPRSVRLLSGCSLLHHLPAVPARLSCCLLSPGHLRESIALSTVRLCTHASWSHLEREFSAVPADEADASARVLNEGPVLGNAGLSWRLCSANEAYVTKRLKHQRLKHQHLWALSTTSVGQGRR